MTRKIIWLLSLSFSITLIQATWAEKVLPKTKINVKLTTNTCTCKSVFFESLSLSPEQQTQISAIRTSANLIRAGKDKELMRIQDQIEELISVDKLDENKLNTLLTQKKNIMIALIKEKIFTRNQIYSLLTDQQKIKYNKMIHEWKKTRLQKLDHFHEAVTT